MIWAMSKQFQDRFGEWFVKPLVAIGCAPSGRIHARFRLLWRSVVVAFVVLFAVGISSFAATSPLADAAEKSDRATVRTLLKQHADVNAPHADGMTALHWAAYLDDFEMAKLLTQAKANVAATNRYGVSPLSLAGQNGNAAMVELLLERGADPNTTSHGGETVLMTAARTGKPGPVNALIKRGADVNAKERRGQTALMWAAADGHTEVVELLIKAGADINATLADSGFTAFFFAIRDGRAAVVRALLKAGVDLNEVMEPRKPNGKSPARGTSALVLAVENGHFELAVDLIQAGADPNDQRSGFTPLHMMTWIRKPPRGEDQGAPPPLGSGNLSDVQFVRKLVEHGANVNARLATGRGGFGKYNTKGATPFLMASATADVAYMRLLLDLGADPSIGNVDNCTPLMVACGIHVGSDQATEVAGEEPEVLEAAQLLLKLGADVNAVDANGETAMHGAALKNLPKVVRFLAENGAKVEVWNKKNKFGSTPLMLAQGYRPGNFKPSFETIDAIQRVMLAAGVPLPTNVGPSVLRNSDWEPVPAVKTEKGPAGKEKKSTR
jgi:ankyrin repeat protein